MNFEIKPMPLNCVLIKYLSFDLDFSYSIAVKKLRTLKYLWHVKPHTLIILS